MEKIKLQVSGSQIQVVQRPAAITAGTVGLEVEFTFDSHWDNLGKTVIFRAGDKVITAALKQDTHIVPWEVLEKPEVWLVVGVYGANTEGTVVIPTLWTKVAAVYTGVEPEGDPALEPSNPIWQQTLARVATMEPLVQEHINSTDNPHGITCDQIGAVTQKEFRDVVSNLDGSSDPDQLIPHLLNQDNPHGVTAVQAGAAPAGYGLGETSAKAQTWNSIWKNGFFREKRHTPDNPAGVNDASYPMWYGITCVESGGNQTNIAFSRDVTKGLTEVRRYKEGNNFGEWEYVNPPMVEGVEYRTTERFYGKAVYKRLNSNGALEYRLDGESTWHPYTDLMGAAPAGYGYGEYIYIGAEPGYLLSEKIDTATESWDDWTTKQCMLYEADFYSYTIIATVCKFNDNYILINGITANGCQVIRKRVRNTWYEWEWVNPPLELNTEYCTTERFNNKHVYAKRLNFGTGVDGTRKVALDAATDSLVRIEGYWYYTSDSSIKHFFDTAPFVNYITTGKSENVLYLYVNTIEAATFYTGCPVIYYTKS